MEKDSKASLSVVTVPRPDSLVVLKRPVALSYWSLKRGQDLGYARAGEPPEEEVEEISSETTIRV